VIILSDEHLRLSLDWLKMVRTEGFIDVILFFISMNLFQEKAFLFSRLSIFGNEFFLLK